MTSPLRALKSEILQPGADLWINEPEFERIRACLPANGPISDDDLEVLTEFRREARAVCEPFDLFYFPLLKASLVRDGRISDKEKLLLLRLLYSGGGIDDAEREFLRELRDELEELSPEFESIYRDAMQEEP